jgi:hypothetical protein
MTIDLTGGYDPSLDLMRLERPADDPHFRESVSMWIFNDDGGIQFPRFLLDEEGGGSTQRTSFTNIAFPDGRALQGSGSGDPEPMLDDQGQPTVLAGAGLTYRTIEPFVRSTGSFRGEMIDTTSATLLHREGGFAATEGPTVMVELDVEMRSVVPPWEQGTMSAAARERMKSDSPDARHLGLGWRFEQLVLASGRCRIGDGEEYAFEGRGLRVHRQSSRQMAGFSGHCWQTTVFPSGRAFGHISFPGQNGKPSYAEGFVFDGERMIPAEPVTIPWLTTGAPSGQDASIVFDSDMGRITIRGETYATTFANLGELLLQQGCTSYEWDGEQAYGMVERSTQKAQLAPPST